MMRRLTIWITWVKKKRKILEARSLIKAGLGRGPKVQENTGFEIVSASDNKIAKGLLPIMDSRKYNSDNEDYDSDDYAETLVLETMMFHISCGTSKEINFTIGDGFDIRVIYWK